MKRTFFAAAALAVALLVSGCANVQKASKADSDQAKAFAPVGDKAVLYVYRDESFGSAIKMPVSVDGVIVGETGPKSFLQLTVAPGRHTIVSHTETNPAVTIDAQAGQSYYVWQEVKMGMWAARSLLHTMPAGEGQAGVRKCELLQPFAPGMRTIATTAPTAPAATGAPVAAAPAAAGDDDATPAAVAPAPAQAAPGGIAALDDRVSKPMFVAAQDIASKHQCERLLRVRSVDGDDAHFFSACPGSSTPIEIACHGSTCNEAPPQG
ncbi:DUF2846 domain-containing protein [Luteibacter yeojuensis]|uniref:DUF2846 domain-containing protein n=1 Tax=Luteibacter yeojuensis TaxID=345309 RepID=UPI000695BDB4|nr:DUF2846 domain-containing protein [Luteibacter yeojuensis]